MSNSLPLDIGELEEQLREEFEEAYRERLEATEARADRLEASLKAEIDRNTPLEARMRKALEEIRSFVMVPRDPDDDMADQLNARSVIRMAMIARNALLVESSERMHDALGTAPHAEGRVGSSEA